MHIVGMWMIICEVQLDKNFDVDTSTPGTFLIRVEIPDPLDPTCYAEDEIEVIVNGNPIIALGPIGDPTCGNSDGSIAITVSGGSGDFYYCMVRPYCSSRRSNN